jgi:hypothetical protein
MKFYKLINVNQRERNVFKRIVFPFKRLNASGVAFKKWYDSHIISR